MVRLLILVLLCAGPLAAQERDTLQLELVLDPREETPFEGEMILATLRGLYRETITNEELKLRSMTDFAWTRLGQDDWTDQRIDGRQVKVFERRLALYPKRAGSLQVLPIAHELEILDAEGKRITVLVRSDPVIIEVREKPVGAGDAWLPVRALELSDSWDAEAARLEDGQSVKRRVVLRALGATPEMMPQQPPLRAPWLITFTPPEDRDFQVTAQGPVTTLTWTWSLRPITGAPGVLPEVTIPYFDTAARTNRSAILPAATIGYASFADNRATGWRRDLGVGLPHVAAALTGFFLILAVGARGHVLSSATLGRWRRNLRLRRDLRRLGRDARKGDVTSFRRRARHLLKADRTVPPDRNHPLLEPVDASLFGREGHGRPTELDPAFRDIRHRLLLSDGSD
ncbi:hypothetical protein ACOXXX_06125 [Thalassococcus sp. BH17M4-6]|uniref:hypothetical protein n=1 Tax=Thalassococcus sp. BH17M4-6 TaxID=3413148 RepID=UPI003BE16A53